MRTSAGRWVGLAVLVLVPSLAVPRAATAQVDDGALFVGPGSTAQGDFARGLGVLYVGLGRYNLETAMATSINVDTAIRWNEYVSMCWYNWNRARLARIAVRSQKRKESFDAIQERIRYEPNARDLANGDALNALLVDLCDPTVGPSLLQSGSPTVPVAIVQKIPFSYAAAGGVLSLGRMLVNEGDWPIGLRVPDLAADRKAYATAIDRALDEIARSRLEINTVRLIEAALTDLRTRNDRSYTPADQISYSEGSAYLKRVEAAVRMLRTAVGAQAITELDSYAGTTVADLVEFMHSHNLRFAPAVTPEERELYRSLYQAMIEQTGTSLGEDKVPRGHVRPVRPDADRR